MKNRELTADQFEGTNIDNILSPDGIEIRSEDFDNNEEAIEYYKTWKKRFVHQGYYSSSRERIPLDQLDEYCTPITR